MENKATVCMLDFCGRLCQSSNYHHSRTWTCPPSALAPSPASYSDPSSMTELHLLLMQLGHSELSEGNKQQQQQKKLGDYSLINMILSVPYLAKILKFLAYQIIF